MSPGANEPRIFSRYILGREADARTAELYCAAVEARTTAPAARDARRLAFALEHPWSIGSLDAALALVEPTATLRRRLLIMAAVLETQPSYADRFFTHDRSVVYALSVFFVGVRAIARACAGMILLRFL